MNITFYSFRDNGIPVIDADHIARQGIIQLNVRVDSVIDSVTKLKNLLDLFCSCGYWNTRVQAYQREIW